jgi:hypothetical protein
MKIYDLLQEMIDYPNRCVITLIFIQLFFNLPVIPMLIQDIRNKTPDSVLSMISYCSSFGINLLLTIQIVIITEGVNSIVKFVAILVSFPILMLEVWLMVAAGYKEKRNKDE